jgi:CHAT domain-containing protein
MTDIPSPDSPKQGAPQESVSPTSQPDLARAFDDLIKGRPVAEAPGSQELASPNPGVPDSAISLPTSPAEPGQSPDQFQSSPERCPQPAAWSLLLSGEAQPFEADELLTHAAYCPACGSLLRSLSADPSADEIASIQSFSSSSSDWQRKLAVRLAQTPHKSASPKSAGQARNKISPLYLWGGLALAATLLLAVGGVLAWRVINSPERLLAKAYSQSRIYEFRVPGAAFAVVTPQVHLRGGSTGREAAPLLDARARIEKELEAAPDNARWLQLQARADILEEKFDSAIDILDRLVARGPVTSALLTDAATAYFQRGAATGSQNDRSTALEYLRRADELTPGDPVVLFNEALAMEDRAQVMNAVETWNRYLRFERDPLWLAEGRRHLESLEQRLNQLKTHQSRIDHYLAAPDARRALAADSASLAKFDEELANYQIPEMLDSAFPLPVDRSRGSPCNDDCLSARTLIYALAASLERNHRDSWLTQLLPPPSSTPQASFVSAAHLLAAAIHEDQTGEFLNGKMHAAQAVKAFRALHNPSGEVRSQVELSYSSLRNSDFPGCYRAAHAAVGNNPGFVWPMLFALTQNHICDPSPNSIPEDDPAYWHIADLARKYHYTLVELRARNLVASAEIDAGNAETAWHVYSSVVRDFYAADLPPIRLMNSLMGLEAAEGLTPRVRTTYLLQREVLAVLNLTPAIKTIPAERFKLAAVAIRAGLISEGKEQMRIGQAELAANGNEKSLPMLLTEDELLMAQTYYERGDLSAALQVLDRVHARMAGQHNGYYERLYAAQRGQLELSLGHPENAESILRDALFDEEKIAGTLGAATISRAQDNRPLYAALAAVWLAQGRSGEDILALWERYRMRILGNPVPICSDKQFICGKPQLSKALAQLGTDQVIGQVVLGDRLLLYRANAGGVSWKQTKVSSSDLMEAVESLERSVTSPSTPQPEIDMSAQKVGSLFFGQLGGQLESTAPGAEAHVLLLEPDPLLGNVPWPSVEVSSGPIGLHFNLSESPSLLLNVSNPSSPNLTGQDSARLSHSRLSPASVAGKSLIVGASVAADESQMLPEVMDEAKAVAAFTGSPALLLGSNATQAGVAARLPSAVSIHFAGHAAEEFGATRLLLAQSPLSPAQSPPLPPQSPLLPHKSGIEASTISTANNDARPDTIAKPWLDSSLIRSHPPRAARLAVFSACATGKKSEGWNHGMGDIVSALASVGVPDVVATRWQIDSNSAIPLMDSFYKNLAAGQTVPQALTSARLALMRNPRYRHPYYWAAWYASGRGNSTLTQIFHEPQ